MSTNKPEKLQPPYPGGDPVVGRALRRFFLGLLIDENLYTYHQDRDAYIEKNVRNPTAKKLLMSTSFIDIERHILALTSSSRAKPLFVVCPPY